MADAVGTPVSIALISAGSALLGSLVGVASTIVLARQARKEKRRDEIRAAYAESFTALDVKTFRETQHIAIHTEVRKIVAAGGLTDEQRAAAMAPLFRLQQALDSERDQAVPQESPAFARLMILDGKSAEFAELDRIRKIEPFMSSNTVDSATGNFVPNIDRFWELEKAQAQALGQLAVRLSDRFAK
jgi:hypothetical protein